MADFLISIRFIWVVFSSAQAPALQALFSRSRAQSAGNTPGGREQCSTRGMNGILDGVLCVREWVTYSLCEHGWQGPKGDTNRDTDSVIWG